MALYERIFSVPDVGHVHLRFRAVLVLAEQVEAEAKRAGLAITTRATRNEILRAYDIFNRDLDKVAERTAAAAMTEMRARFNATAKRPDTRVGPHLRDALIARPLHRLGTLSTGEVGVADIDVLNQIVNPTMPSAGPYWEAQEYGTSAHVGRIIRGYFYGPGYTNPMRPLASPPSPLQPIFVPASLMAGPAGGRGGLGEIQRPIVARHFIRDGADKVEGQWLAGIGQAQADTIRALEALV